MKKSVILPKDKSTNTGGLWLGNICAAENVKDLKDSNINFVVTAMPKSQSEYLSVMYAENQITHKIIDVLDFSDQNVKQHFTECCEFIENALENSNVLIHCFQGKSRSTTLVAAYLVKTWNRKVDSVLDFIREQRPDTKPNDGFLDQLYDWEKDLATSLY